uniref:PX domain-containing protein n=2 Tax=Zea mays TaxID=4577 RepID=A0A804PXV0_MAIZE
MATSSSAGARKKAPSPPKHRHDGTSPLPLGMDWSPPPKRWEGRNTIWPHNPQTGWSYCVMIPSWITQTPETGVTADSFLKSVVFYRIHVGIQSPEGFSSSHGILRRFSDFLNLSSDLKSAFPRKDAPSAPPKHAFLRINSSRLLLEERRHALEEWMQKLLSDIDLSRSAPVAAFFELEAAARSYFQERNGRPSESDRSNWKGNLVLEHDGRNGSAASYRGVVSDEDRVSNPGHARKDSAESIGSDLSSLRGIELSIPGVSSSLWDGAVVDGHISQTEHLTGLDMHLLYDMDAQVILPNDQKQKLTRLLITMQQRIGAAKTDMEDLIARLNQEAAVKEYLTTKVKDLEVELEAAKQKGRETLQQAILTERERITQMQWDMDELRRKYSEMESNLKAEQNEKTRAESEKTTASDKNETLLEELEIKRKEVETLKHHLVEAEAKSKADKKVLVKEVKSLRNSQTEMKKVLNQYLEQKTGLERVIIRDKQRSARAKLCRVKFLHECRLLHERLLECSAKFLAEEQGNFTIDPSSLPDALDLLATSDNRVRLLIAEAQLLARDDEQGSSDDGDNSDSISSLTMSWEDAKVTDEDATKILSDLLIDNAQLRLRLNAVIRNAVNTAVKPEKEGFKLTRLDQNYMMSIPI